MTQGTKAVIFDLDGTLVRRTTVSLYLSDWLGHRALIERLEQEYADGQIDNRQFAAQDAAFYEGRLRTEVWQQLSGIAVVNGIHATVKWLHEHQIAALLATMTSSLAAEYFMDRYAFDDAFGCEMDEDSNGRLGGTIRKYVEPKDKVRFLRGYCQANDIDPSQCVAVGDARADVPLFAEVGLAIALNGTEEANRAADCVLATEDLTDIVPLIARRDS